jgi:hypothetical protein
MSINFTDDDLVDSVSVPIECVGRSVDNDLEHTYDYAGNIENTKVKTSHREYTYRGKRELRWLDMDIEVEIKIRTHDDNDNFDKKSNYKYRPFLKALPKEALETITNGIGIAKVYLPK